MKKFVSIACVAGIVSACATSSDDGASVATNSSAGAGSVSIGAMVAEIEKLDLNRAQAGNCLSLVALTSNLPRGSAKALSPEASESLRRRMVWERVFVRKANSKEAAEMGDITKEEISGANKMSAEECLNIFNTAFDSVLANSNSGI